MKTVLIIFGTRPEAIKMCPLVRELKTHREFQTLVAVTGQHREMLTEVLKVFSLTPEFDLDVMKPGQTLLALNGALLFRIGELLETLRPDLVLVHGDTATAFAAATAAFFCGIPIGHVEAGLRSGNIHAPFPEEYNRSAISLISTLDFAPTEVAKETLLAMGKPCARVFVTGNTVVDALHFTRDLRGRIPLTEDAEGKHIVFLTSHRRENLGDAQRSIFRAAVRIADALPDVRIICPLHRNPQVRTAAREIFCARKHPHIFLTEPFDVVTCHHVLSQSTLVLTDSGGIQEEASALGVPLLVLRDTTERPEIVRAGAARLVGTDEDTVTAEACRILSDERYRKSFEKSTALYGDGKASVRIAEKISEFLANQMLFLDKPIEKCYNKVKSCGNA